MITVLSTILLFSALDQARLADDVVRVFILAGQSNMVGSDARADAIDSIPSFVGAGRPQEAIRYWYMHGPTRPENGSGKWVALQPDTRRNLFGPELTFGRKVEKLTPGPIAIIKSAWGGTTLARDWDPDAPSDKRLYERTMKLVADALGDLKRQGVKFKVEAVLWHQGENDMLNRDLMTGYGKRLEAFIARWRKDLKTPDLKWFVGEISGKGIWGLDHRKNMQVVRAQQRAVCDGDPRVWWVPTSHLAFDVMGHGQPHYHFGTEGQLQHGEAYADAYLAATGRAIAPKTRPFSGKPVKKGQRVRVFVVAGQRTAEGDGAYVSQMTKASRPSFERPQGNVRYRFRLGGGARQSKDWTALGPASYFGTFGPELSIGQALDRGSEDPVAIVKITHSAAALQDWLPNPTNASRPQYRDAVAFIRQAMRSLEGEGARPTLEGVFWFPGEHDAYWGAFRNHYAEDLATLIAAFRTELEAPKLRFIIGELSDRTRWGKERLDALDAQIKRVSDKDPLVHFVDTDAIPAPENCAAIGTDATLLLGTTVAVAYLRSAK